jgi:hypothetical protein
MVGSRSEQAELSKADCKMVNAICILLYEIHLYRRKFRQRVTTPCAENTIPPDLQLADCPNGSDERSGN